MRVRLVSDVHLEMPANAQKLIKQIVKAMTGTGNPSEELLVLAGDIGNPFSSLYGDFLRAMADHFAHVVVVMGNHEYYQHGTRVWDHEQQRTVPQERTMSQVDAQAREVVSKIPKVTLLQKERFDYGGIRILGCTMWSPGDSISESMMNDGRLIPNFGLYERREIHRDHVSWLERELAVPYDGLTLVVTHHLPTHALIAPEFATHPGNSFFACHLDHLVKKADAWICGHTHKYVEAKVGKCKCMVNPVGYKCEASTFIPGLYLEK